MSTQKSEAQNAGKVVTKYDLKMQKRAEDKKKEAATLMAWRIAGIIAILVIIGFIASFPIRRVIAETRTVITVDGEKIGQVEFDYMYNTVKNNYMQNYGSYLSYYGLSADSDPSTVMYSDKLSFKDYFEKLAVEQIKENLALKKEATAAGYTYDASEDWKEFSASVSENAKANGVSEADFIRSSFGQYASKSKLKPIVENAAMLAKYYEEVYDSKLPSDTEIEEYYNENKDTYDSVDYFLTTINAELPTEPTELADEGAEVAEDGTYTPSDAEKEAAMEEAKAKAEEAEDSVMTDGTAHEKELSSSVNYYVRDWLFDEARVQGDTTVIENASSNLYYVVGFSSRYRVEDPTVDIRAIITDTDNGAEIVNEYNATDKTEESFTELVKKYTIDSKEGGLYENQNLETYEGEVKEWLFDFSRKEGDVASFFVEDNYTYVIYFKNEAEPVWKLSVTDAMMNTRMNDYMNAIVEGMEVSGSLNYLAVEAAEEAAASEAENVEAENTEAEAGEEAESTPAEGEAETESGAGE